MKFGRTAWLVLIIGIFVIAIGSLYWLYMQDGREQEQLSQTLSTTQATLPKLASERTNSESTLTDLEDRLAQAISQLRAGKAVFPASVQSIEIDEMLFGIADNWSLEITNLTATEPGDTPVSPEIEDIEAEDIEVEDVNYQLTPFTVEVKGQVSDILNFFDSVVNQRDFSTATVELVTIVVPEPVSETERALLTKDEIEDRETPSATINIVIYAYEGE